ncbi:MAG: hypothetical protein WCI02_07550 [Planctomycetota bacterium]
MRFSRRGDRANSSFAWNLGKEEHDLKSRRRCKCRVSFEKSIDSSGIRKTQRLSDMQIDMQKVSSHDLKNSRSRFSRDRGSPSNATRSIASLLGKLLPSNIHLQ